MLYITKIIETIEKKSDVQTFIKKYTTPCSFPEKLKFQSYISSNKVENVIDSELDEGICKEIKEILANALLGKILTNDRRLNVSNIFFK